jgi:hypothetical protein
MQRPSAAGQLPAVIVSGQLHARDLLTDGLSPCLTAGPRPSFSWQLGQPEHADPSRATMTGYELVVEDSAGTPVWSSGQVASARLSAGFDGPALDDDTDYAWRWNRTGGQLRLECTVPAGVTAVVRLPAGTYGIQGPTAGDAVERSAPVSAASVGRDPDGGPAGTAAKVDFRIHTGAWSFTPGS